MTNVAAAISFGKMESHSSPPSPKAGRPAPRRAIALKPIGRFAVRAADKVLAKYGLGEAALMEQWPEIIGAHWARLCLPQHLNRRTETLTLRVFGPAALELMHQESELVSRINTFCGRRLIKRLKILQGPASRPRPPAKATRTVSAEDEELLTKRTAAITDLRLREALLSLGRAMKA